MRRGKKSNLSEICQMYRPAGVSTFHDAWNPRATNVKQVYYKSGTSTRPKDRDAVGDHQSYSRLPISSRETSLDRNKKVLCLSEREAKRIEQVKAVYLNNRFHKMRFEAVRDKILKAHESKIKSDISIATHATNKRTEANATRLKELCEVREKFFKEKKSRLNRTHVSLTAVEMPQVSRYAYGLPAEGHEFTLLKRPDPEKIKEKYRQLWKTSMKRASKAINVFDSFSSRETRLTLPNIVIRQQSPKKKSSGHASYMASEKELEVSEIQDENTEEQEEQGTFSISPLSSSHDLDQDSLPESDFEYD